MGAVYEAVHQTIHRRVAIKVLHPEAERSSEAINRFINEARATNIIQHPGLVQTTDFGHLPDGSGYLVMEFLVGETLDARLQATAGKLPPEDAVHVATQIASAIAACHKKGLVHRDLKPGNIMLVPDPTVPTGERVKVLDFGLAKLLEVREAAFVKTDSQLIIGTPLYMSPEQCEGAGRVDAKTDVYALGCMLYELLSGRPPFRGDGMGQVLGQHMFKPPEPLIDVAPWCPPALASLIDRLLIKAKDDRPSMRETQKALEELATSLPPPHRREAIDPSGSMGADAQLALGLAATQGADGPAQPSPAAGAQAGGSLSVDAQRALGLASTFGQGVGETGGPRRERRRLQLIVASLALSALVLGFWVLRRSAADRSVQPEPAMAAVPAPPPPPKPVTAHIESKPPGASVIDAQSHVVLGKTPWERQSPPQEGTLTLKLHLSGYQDQTVRIQQDSDEHAAVTLTPLPPVKKPVLKRIAAPIKKLASKIAAKLKKKPAKKETR